MAARVHGHGTGQYEDIVWRSQHWHSSRPEFRANPTYRLDPDFVERGDLLDRIHKRVSVPAARVALVGVGVVGKSQLAIEYVYRLRKQTPEDTWVLWIHASNATRFEKSFRDIVDFLKIFGRKDPKANIYELVRDRLRNGKKGRWLLVLDSADDTSFLVDSSAQKLGQRTSDHNRAGRLLDYLPICDYSAILVTTRNQKVASELVDDGDIVVVQPMAEQRAVTLLKKKIGDQFQENDLIELATTLEFMPLAIAHAAAFIKHRVPRYSGQHYLDEFRRNDRSKTSLLYYNLGHFRRDIEYTNSIILTWQISFEHIFQTRRSAADLLSLMSFFDPQAIPESLLIHRDGEAYDSGETSSILAEVSSSETSHGEAFEIDVGTLRDYSFISVTTDNTTFRMHRLVQLATRSWLESEKQLERWKMQYLNNLDKAFPSVQYGYSATCRSLYPHAKSTLDFKPEGKTALLIWASVLYRAAAFAMMERSPTDTLALAKASMETRITILGREDIDALASMLQVAQVLDYSARWAESEELNLKVIKTSKKILGAEHQDTLNSIGHLATFYSNQGRYAEAAELESQVLQVMSKVLGLAHPDVLMSMSALAITYRNLNRLEDAALLGETASRMMTYVLGEEATAILMCESHLVEVFLALNRTDQAEKLALHLIETSKTVLGEENLFTLRTTGQLAEIYYDRGQLEKAEKMQELLDETFKKTCGEAHRETLRNMHSTAMTQCKLGRHAESTTLLELVLELEISSLGAQHPDTLHTAHNLTLEYFSLERWENLRLLEEIFMQTRIKINGEAYAQTQSSMEHLSAAYMFLGRLGDAESMAKQLLLSKKQLHGQEHRETLPIMKLLLSIYLK